MCEIAYYLESSELLFLLALIDQRPVAGLPQMKDSEDWQKVALSVLKSGRLRYESGRLVIAEALEPLLLGMKNAEQVCAVYTEYPAPVRQTIYAGEQTVQLEALSDGLCRVHQGQRRELWQQMEAALPPRCAPEELEAVLTDSGDLAARLKKWEKQKISLEDSADGWLQLSEVHCVVERQMPPARWIWAEDSLACLLMHQDREGLRVELDTRSRRQRLAEELGWEA